MKPKAKIKTKTKMTPEIVQFEKDMNVVFKHGYVTHINYMSEKNGIEMSLPPNVTITQANAIAYHIKNKYNLQALFFVKKHTITVYYE